MKKIIFWFVLLVMVVFITESFGHLLYRIIKGEWLWELPKLYSVFNIRPFTELVNDDRLVANKRNFNHIIRENCFDWKVAIDSNRFRIGRNKYFKDKDNIVFLGDSVLFGWGIEGEKSVPSQFYDLLKKNSSLEYSVINATVPSYSLYQAIKNYEYEINGKFPVKYIILQIYDPASQFLIWGRRWNKKMCWASNDTLVSREELIKENVRMQNPLRKILNNYSSIYYSIYYLQTRLEKVKKLPLLLDINDKEAFVFFEKEILMMLEDFFSLLKKEKAVLIILPANPNRFLSANTAFDLESKMISAVIECLNKTQHRFASTHKDVYFFDVSSYFDSIGRDGLFIDDYHLSEAGSQKQAEFIFEQLRANNLL